VNQGVGIDANECDSVIVELHDAFSPSTIVGTSTAVLNINGQGTFTYSSSLIGQNVYIVVIHRNTIQTWSALPVTLSASTSYDFTTGAGQAYGSNQVEVEPGVWAMYAGDMNQDGFVDIFDYPAYETDQLNLVSFSYVATDLNGDGFVDIFDYPVFEANQLNLIMMITP
jgi:hypothetical protein